MELKNHPSVREHLSRKASSVPASRAQVDKEWLRSLVLEEGADDVGLASIDSPELDGYRESILAVFPETRALVSVVCRLNPESIRSSFRQQYELEFHQGYADVDHVMRRAVSRLSEHGVRSLMYASTYPMNMDNWANHRMWYVAHKPVAVAAGRGRLGVHRMVVHPRYGASIALATILVAHDMTGYDEPLGYDPCVKCMICVVVCPVGAIHADGHYNGMACLTHSYRDKYGGFTDWVENMVRSRTPRAYRQRVSDAETVAMWQSLSLGTTFKCANCMAVCPGGSDLIGDYVEDAKGYRNGTAKRLQERRETVFVVKGSDAEAHVLKRFPHKPVKYVSNCVRPATVRYFFDFLPNVFQREASKGVEATYHFSFTGEETLATTVVIRDQAIRVRDGHEGKADLEIFADSRTWLRFLAGECSLPRALLTRRLKLKGSPLLLRDFGRCFHA